MNITGQCHCGAISFTALVDPAKVLVCHCADCQQLSAMPWLRDLAAVPVREAGYASAWMDVAQGAHGTAHEPRS